MNISPVLLIAIPLLTAFLIPILSLFYKKIGNIIVPLLMLFLFVASLFMFLRVFGIVVYFGDGDFDIITADIVLKAPYGISLVVTPLSAFFLVIITSMAFLISIYSLKFNSDTDTQPISKYSVLYTLIVMGSLGMVMTQDIFNLFVFFEITSISAYSLTAIKRDRYSLEASIKYLIIGSVASIFILIAIALCYHFTGNLNIVEIARNFRSIPNQIRLIIIVLFFIGFGIEAELFPLNMWVPDVYQSSKTNITALFSSITVKASLFVLFRVLFTFRSRYSQIFSVIVFVGLATMLISEIVAFRQKDLKRMLAFSSLGQIGLIVSAVCIANSRVLNEGAMFHLLNHSMAKALLFMVAGYFAIRIGSSKIADLKGISRKMPFSSVLFTIGSLSIIGVPLLSGFISKFVILQSLARMGLIVHIFIILLSSLIEVAYYFKVIYTIYSKPESNNDTGDSTLTVKINEAPITLLIPAVIICVVIILLGVYPELLKDIFKIIGEELRF